VGQSKFDFFRHVNERGLCSVSSGWGHGSHPSKVIGFATLTVSLALAIGQMPYDSWLMNQHPLDVTAAAKPATQAGSFKDDVLATTT